MQTDISEAGLQGGGVGKEYLTVFQPWLKRDTPPPMLFAWAESELTKSQHPWKGLGSGRTGGKAGGLLPRKTQGGRGTQRRGGSCSPPGGAVEVEPVSGHAGGDFLELVSGKAVFRRDRATSQRSRACTAGKLAAKLGSTERRRGCYLP